MYIDLCINYSVASYNLFDNDLGSVVYFGNSGMSASHSTHYHGFRYGWKHSILQYRDISQ